MRFSKLRGAVAAIGMLAVAGCSSVPPERITVDRLDYGQVIAESWKRQTLLNVVRLRYADAPVFLDVASIINSYTRGGKASANAQNPSMSDPNVVGLSIGAEGNWSNTPTVTYQPLLGDRFTRSMLQPVPPAAVFQLLQGGWPAEIVFDTVVGSINGLRNNAGGVGADPGYREFVDVLSRIQRAAALAIRVEPRKDGSAVVMVLRPEGLTATVGDDAGRLVELLRIERGTRELDITFGLLPRNPREVAVVTRSMLELLLQLGFGIDVPQAHVTAGRVLPGRRREGDTQGIEPVRIHSGPTAPEDAYAAVSYKDHWFWIDDKDIRSKRIFTFLLILTSLAETGQGSAAPVVTVPSR